MSTYTTVQGDKWDLIAFKHYGSISNADKLIQANLQYVDTYIFPAGIVLNIPSIDSDTSIDALPPWKQVT